MAERAFEDKIFNQVCFHSQQGVEKTLKGFLRDYNRTVPKTHILKELLDLCIRIDKSFTQFQEDCE